MKMCRLDQENTWKMSTSVFQRKFPGRNGGCHFPCILSVQTTHGRPGVARARNGRQSWPYYHGNIDIGPKSWHSLSQSARAGPRSSPFYHGNIDISPKRSHSRFAIRASLKKSNHSLSASGRVRVAILDSVPVLGHARTRPQSDR